MPKIAEIEYTPNPNAVKFVLKEPVAIGFPKNYPDREAALSDPTALALFDVDGVASVFMQDKWLTVTKRPDLPWSDLLPRLATPIRSAPSATGAPAFAASPASAIAQDKDDAFLQQVRQALDETIMPALAADGGGLEIVGHQDKRVLIRYQGACSTCPAGMGGTLMAIEAILQRDVDPEITVLTV